jgi:hypothetical protein
MASPSTDNFVARGAWGEVRYAIDAHGQMPAKAFVEGLSEENVRKVYALFRRMAQDGKIVNREKFRKERGEIFAFKSFQIRISCFRLGGTWYLAYGFSKKANRWKDEDLDRADRIRLEHLQRTQTHTYKD